MKTVIIGICTRKRFKNLNKTLSSIYNLQLKNYKLKILIIENNNKKTLNSLLKNYKIKKKISISHYLEKKIGIPFARNKFLQIIKKIKGDFVSFVDDDCILDKKWLISMDFIHKKNRADVLTGPQISLSKKHYLKTLDRKVTHLKKVSWAATNNIFCRKDTLLNSGLEFDIGMRDTGGSDQLFFKQLTMKGKIILWNSNAKIYEIPQKKRENFKWFILRCLRYGLSSNLIYKKLYGSFFSFFIVIFKSVFEIIKSSFFFVMILFNPKDNFYNFVQNICKGIGTFLSLFNVRLNKYY